MELKPNFLGRITLCEQKKATNGKNSNECAVMADGNHEFK